MIKLLIVDDSSSDRLLLIRSLETAGLLFELKEAVSVENARELLTGFVPNAILLDIYMPGQSGLDFLKELRGNTAYDSVCIVIATGQNVREDINEAFINGANGYVVKPVSFEDWNKIAETLKHLYQTNDTKSVLDRLKELNTKLDETNKPVI